MKRTLKVFSGFSLPIESVCETFGLLGSKGGGKSYAIMKMMEEMLINKLPVCGIDAMGIFWGLRASADGKDGGLPIHIMGGDHADVPLVPTAGKVVAELIAKENISCILDISDWRKHEQKKFVTDFAEELYHQKKKYRDPLHLFLDEGDLWIPQKMWDQGDERMAGAFDDIVRRGRVRGLGITMATQRPAVINKNALSQVSVLIAMKMGAPADIEVIDTWVKHNGTKAQRDEMVSTLSSLEKGDAWLWSPGWLKTFKKLHVTVRETFDSSKTPELGEKIREPKRLAPVDIETLRKTIADTVQQAEASDPKALKLKILELGAQRDRLQKALEQKALKEAVPVISQKEVEKTIVLTKTSKIKVPVLKAGQSKKLAAALTGLSSALSQVIGLKDSFAAQLKAADAICSKGLSLLRSIKDWKVEPTVGLPLITNGSAVKQLTKQALAMPLSKGLTGMMKKAPEESPETKLRKGEKAMLAVFCQFFPNDVTHARVGAIAGFHSTGDTYATYLGVLKRLKYVETGPVTGRATELGRQVCGPVPPLPMSKGEILDMWSGRVRAGEKAMLQHIALCDAIGNSVTLEEWGQGVGYTNIDTLKTYAGTLKRLGLVEEKDKRFTLSEHLV